MIRVPVDLLPDDAPLWVGDRFEELMSEGRRAFAVGWVLRTVRTPEVHFTVRDIAINLAPSDRLGLEKGLDLMPSTLARMLDEMVIDWTEVVETRDRTQSAHALLTLGAQLKRDVSRLARNADEMRRLVDQPARRLRHLRGVDPDQEIWLRPLRDTEPWWWWPWWGPVRHPRDPDIELQENP